MKSLKGTLFLLMLVASAVAYVACAPAVDTEAEKAAVVAAIDDLWNAFKAKNMDALERVCSKELYAIGVEQGQQWENWNAFSAYMKLYFDMEDFELKSFQRENQHVRLSPAGDAAWYSETYSETFTVAGQDTTSTGKFTLGLEKGESGWVIVHWHVSKSTPPAIPADELKAAIQAEQNRYAELVAGADVDALLGMYNDDAALIPPDTDRIEGKEALRAAFEQWFEMGSWSVSYTTERVIQAGEMVIDIGNYTSILRTTARTEMKESGKSLYLWKKDPDGNWKISIEIWNTNQPAR